MKSIRTQYQTAMRYALLIIGLLFSGQVLAQEDSLCCKPLIPPAYNVSETHWDEPSSFWQNGGHVPENLVDEDSTNYARAHIKATGSATARVTDSSEIHPAGIFVGFQVKSRAFRDADFDGVQITTYLNGVLQESKSGDDLEVSHIPDFVNEPICIGFTATRAWNEVEIRMDRRGPRVHYDVFFAVIGDDCNDREGLPPGLPVTWLSFDAQIKGSTTLLTWATAEEFNNAGFEVERSSDGIFFARIGRVDPTSSAVAINTYYFNDDNPVRGINYYRIRQVDIDGRYSFSNMRTVAFQHNVTNMKVWPNPVRDDQINIELGNNVGKGMIRIINSSGSVIKTQAFGEADYRAGISTSGLYPGIYTVIIESQDQVYVEKVMILE